MQSLSNNSQNGAMLNSPTDLGLSRPSSPSLLLFWVVWRVESTPNKREHWTAKHRRSACARAAVRVATAGISPPSLSSA